MKPTTVLSLTASLLSGVEGSPFQQKRNAAPRVVLMDTQRNAVSNPVQRDRIRRRGDVLASLDNEETLYFVNGSLGTPAQSLRLHLDTGSSDLWVNTPSSKLCQEKSDPCSYAGTYAANSSSTYAYVGSWFNISYVDGSGASGDYATDTFTIGNSTLSSLQFGIGYTSSSSQGILGVGYQVNEVQVGRAGKSSYNNLPAQMVEDDLIQSKAYSLWLNDLDASTGSVLFGGVDTEKFSGSLQTVPIQAESGTYAEFLITLTNLALGNTSIASDIALAVLLDSGSSLTYLPDSMVDEIYTQIDAEYDETEGAAYVPCSLANNKTSLTFTFSSPTIEVTMDELVLDLVTSSGQRPTFQNGVTACLFGIAPAGESTNVLGDTFLRSAYVVYDLDNNAISLAQTKFNTTASNIQEIGTGTSAVPDATAVTNAVSATGISGYSSSSSLGVSSAASTPASIFGTVLALSTAFVAGVLMIIF